MTLQISGLYLYNASGDIRTLNFNLGSVNIVAGRSNTGKSAIIPIIEYCLGISDFAVPGEVIRQNVAYYAVSYQIGENSIFIAKPKPLNSSRKQYRVYYAENPAEMPPPLVDLSLNTNDTEIQRNINRLMRQALDVDLELSSSTKSIINTYFYLFQKSTVIAHDSLLFHRQEVDANAIKSTLPYFLGIRRDEDVRLEQELEESRLSIRRLRDRMSQERRQLDAMLLRGRELLVEAQALGLVDISIELLNIENVYRIRALLSAAISNWQPSETSFAPDNRLVELKDNLNIIEDEYTRLYAELRSVEALQKEASGYTKYTEEQRLRLQSINIISAQNPFDFAESSEICPLCFSNFSDSNIDVARISSIRNALQKVEADLDMVKQEQPILEEFIQSIRDSLEEQRRNIENRKLEIAVVRREQSSAKNVADEIYEANSRVDRLLGRIEFFLELAASDSRDELENERQIEQQKYDQLDAEIKSRKSENLERRVVSDIADFMTEWSRRLNLSYSGRFFLDIEQLTVIVDSADTSITMQEMGGSANYLGCHLIALFALHWFFIEQKQPVPSFIVLDQPAQIYFPSQNPVNTIGGDLESASTSDRDLLAVQELFDFLFDICEFLNKKMQVIVLEHAQLNDERFTNSVINNNSWFDTDGLIPQAWIDAPEKSQSQMNLL